MMGSRSIDTALHLQGNPVYSLKTIAWNNDIRKFVSPSCTDYSWEKGINWGICEKCLPYNQIQLDCTCGIYHAPNPEALEEYEIYPTSVIAFIKMYGAYDIWSGPDDLSWTFPSRSDGIRIIGILGNATLKDVGFLEGNRGNAEMLGCKIFEVKLWNWKQVRGMMRLAWKREFGIDPYINERAK